MLPGQTAQRSSVHESGGTPVANWQCYLYGSADRCFEPSYNYRGWYEVSDYMNSTRPTNCAKAVTAAGNVRSGSTCWEYYIVQAVACLGSGEPTTRAYTYWAGTGSATTYSSEARTPASRYYCS